MSKRVTYKSLTDLPQEENYLELDDLRKLRYRDRILSLYMHIPKSDIMEHLMEDMKVCVHYEEYEVAQAYLDLINDLSELGLLY